MKNFIRKNVEIISKKQTSNKGSNDRLRSKSKSPDMNRVLNATPIGKYQLNKLIDGQVGKTKFNKTSKMHLKLPEVLNS